MRSHFFNLLLPVFNSLRPFVTATTLARSEVRQKKKTQPGWLYLENTEAEIWKNKNRINGSTEKNLFHEDDP